MLASIALVDLHWEIITAAHAIDYYEGQIPLITGILAAGNNPYTYELLPENASVYGIVYNLLMVPVAELFGNTLQTHRAVNAFFILACCWLIGRCCWLQSGKLLHSLCAALLSYAAFLYYSTPIAAANALGILLMLLSSYIPWRLRFSLPGLFLSALIAITAVYTKIYFIAGALFVGLYLCLNASLLRAAQYGLMLGLLLFISVAIVHSSSPYYFDLNLFVITSPSTVVLKLDTLWRQLLQFVQLYWGLFVLGLLALLFAVRRDAARHGAENRQAPLFRLSLTEALIPRQLDFFAVCFFGALLIVVVSLGRNPGNWMSYLFQLMTPYFAVMALAAVGRSRLPGLLCVPLILASLYASWQFLPKRFDVDPAPWSKIEQLVADHEQVLSSQMLLMPLIRHNRTIYQDGQTFYFPHAANKPDWAKHKQPGRKVSEVWDSFLQRHYLRVEQQTFDLVLLNVWDLHGVFHYSPPGHPDTSGVEFFKRYYRRVDRISVDLGDMPGGQVWKIDVWKPRKET